jgi:hypothetical protein
VAVDKALGPVRVRVEVRVQDAGVVTATMATVAVADEDSGAAPRHHVV